jgi:hypothetical protein
MLGKDALRYGVFRVIASVIGVIMCSVLLWAMLRPI